MTHQEVGASKTNTVLLIGKFSSSSSILALVYVPLAGPSVCAMAVFISKWAPACRAYHVQSSTPPTLGDRPSD